MINGDRLHVFSGKVLRSEQRGICGECHRHAWLSPMGRLLPHWVEDVGGMDIEDDGPDGVGTIGIPGYTGWCLGAMNPPEPSEARADPYEMSGDYVGL